MAGSNSKPSVKDLVKNYQAAGEEQSTHPYRSNRSTTLQKKWVVMQPTPMTFQSKLSSRHISQPIPDWEKPRLFIETDVEGELIVNKETEQCLEKITQPVVVVSVVGLYRTGKSFILNRLSGLGQGFSLGATVESTTKGIWIWVVPHPQRDDCRLVLVDTEGLGDMDKTKLDHDIWIFALGILLSGTFVYNSKGAIDQKAMNDLHLVTEIAERINVKSKSDENIGVNDEGGNTVTSSSGDEDEELKKFFPSFVWALRDCTLKLEIGGKTISPDEYLEHALTATESGQAKDLKASDKPRAKLFHAKDCIKDYFPQRRCFVFPIPVESTKLMDKIDTLEDRQFDKDFLKVVREFCDYIFTESKVKTIFNDITTGRALARLATIYVESIRNGNAPCIQNAVQSTAKIENERAIKESVDIYTKKFEASVTFPTATQQEICDCHARCSKEAFDYFLSKSVFDSEKEYYKQLSDIVEEAHSQFRGTNEIKSGEACGKILKDLYQKIKDKDYSVRGGYNKYDEDVKELVDTYKETPHLEDVAAQVLEAFMKDIEHTRKLILDADTKLTEAEKRKKELKATQEAAERAEKAKEEEQNKIKLHYEALERMKEEHERRLKAKDEEDRKIKGCDEETGAVDKVQKVVEAVLTFPAKAIFAPVKWFSNWLSG